MTRKITHVKRVVLDSFDLLHAGRSSLYLYCSNDVSAARFCIHLEYYFQLKSFRTIILILVKVILSSTNPIETTRRTHVNLETRYAEVYYYRSSPFNIISRIRFNNQLPYLYMSSYYLDNFHLSSRRTSDYYAMLISQILRPIF